MFRHLAKLIGFWGIQAGLFWGLLVYGGDEERQPSKSPLASAPVEEQLATYVKPRVRRLWDADPRVIERALLAGEDQGLIAALVHEFLVGPDNYVAAIYDKDLRLRTTPGERIILVGGSNAAFSMDSRILEERYGLAPVNMGLQAALGVRFMTRHVAEHVRSGDVVLLLVEHTLMWSDPDGHEKTTAYFCRACPEFARLYRPEGQAASGMPAISWAEWKQYADRTALAELAGTTRSSLERLWSEATVSEEEIAKAAASKKEEIAEAAVAAEFDRRVQPLLHAAQRRFVALDRVFARSGFNEYGDMIRHRRETPPGEICPFPAEFGADRIAAVKRNAGILNDFADHCHEVGATVYFVYAPLPRGPRTERLADRFEPVLQSSLKFPILLPIEDSFVEYDDIYGKVYHLTWHGTCKRMQTLCTALDRHLTPQTQLSVREHIAARDHVVSGRLVVAEHPEQSQLY